MANRQQNGFKQLLINAPRGEALNVERTKAPLRELSLTGEPNVGETSFESAPAKLINPWLIETDT